MIEPCLDVSRHPRLPGVQNGVEKLLARVKVPIEAALGDAHLLDEQIQPQ
jgi:hypothetical protein